MRTFSPDATLKHVFDWVTSLDDCNFIDFNLVSNFPRVVYTHERATDSLDEAGLSPQSALFIDIQDDDIEEVPER